jgi:type II secretory pathway pseudopilin PulG
VKRKRTGFTVVEIVTVVTIIAILLGVLIPALSMVRNFAKETKQKAQFASIELALLAFRGDYGDYPPSYGVILPPPTLITNYCGAQKLAEALLGWDLAGFHPDSDWRADGYDENGFEYTYDPDKIRRDPVDSTLYTLTEREDLYLELGTANAFYLGTFTDPATSVTYPGLYNDPTPLEAATFVLCDTFNIKTMTMTGPGGEAVTRKAGTPILYYRANTSSKYELDSGDPPYQQPYNREDNVALINLGRLTQSGLFGEFHKLVNTAPNPGEVNFYEYITDPQLFASTGRRLPYNPDSYILISAGLDGLYGTEDDITNFGK